MLLTPARARFAPTLKVHVLDGHPSGGRLTSHLLDAYVRALPIGSIVTRTNLRDLTFDVNLVAGYAAEQPWEPDLAQVATELLGCDHLVVGFPLWWGAEPARLKGLLDRLILPGFAFRYRRGSPFWDRYMTGRSADVLITMDTPPLYLRAVYGDPVARRWRRQVLGFCGFAPVRIVRFGPTRRGGAARNVGKWEQRASAAARNVGRLRRGRRVEGVHDRGAFVAAVEERRS